MTPAFIAALLLSPALNLAVLNVPPIPPPTVAELVVYASTAAKKNGINTNHLLATISCESLWSSTSTSPTHDFGIVQINRPTHPEITKKQMFDPIWSIDWMIGEWNAGHQSAWVCWTLLESQYGSGAWPT